MTAIRLARGHHRAADHREVRRVHHGHGDALLAESGSGVATLGLPGSAGVPESAVARTSWCPATSCPGSATTWPR